jgi:hypothetical protein
MFTVLSLCVALVCVGGGGEATSLASGQNKLRQNSRGILLAKNSNVKAGHKGKQCRLLIGWPSQLKFLCKCQVYKFLLIGVRSCGILLDQKYFL